MTEPWKCTIFEKNMKKYFFNPQSTSTQPPVNPQKFAQPPANPHQKYFFIIFSKMLQFCIFKVLSPLACFNKTFSCPMMHIIHSWHIYALLQKRFSLNPQPTPTQPPTYFVKKMKLFVDFFCKNWKNVLKSVGASFDK